MMIIGDEPLEYTFSRYEQRKRYFLAYKPYKRHFMTLVIALIAGFAHEQGSVFGVALPTLSKIDCPGDNILWGGAGFTGTIETIDTKLKTLPESMKKKSLHDLDLQECLKEIISESVSAEIIHLKKYSLPFLERADYMEVEAEVLFVAYDVTKNDPVKILDICSHGALSLEKKVAVSLEMERSSLMKLY